MQGLVEIITILIIIFLLSFIPIIGMWKLFEKANQPGWAILVPIYNIITFLEIIGKPGWWVLLWLTPFLNIIWVIWGLNLMVKSFGKSVGFTFGVIFLPFIFIPILGFGDSEYIGPAGESRKDNLENRHDFFRH